LGSFFSKARSIRLFLGLLPLIIRVDMLRDVVGVWDWSGMLVRGEMAPIFRPQRSPDKERKEARMSAANPFPVCAGAGQQNGSQRFGRLNRFSVALAQHVHVPPSSTRHFSLILHRPGCAPACNSIAISRL
jgi:hypothetical protein